MTRPKGFSVALSIVTFVSASLFPVEVVAIPDDEPPSTQTAEIFLPGHEIELLPIGHNLTQIVVGESLHDKEARKERERLAAISAQNARRATSTVKKVPVDRSKNIAIAREVFREFYPDSEWDAFNTLVMRESGWNERALNKSSGACGIPQSLPCSKMPQGIDTPVEGQIRWMLNYIKRRYQNPSNALRHSDLKNWY